LFRISWECRQQFLFGKHSEHGIFFSKAEELISGVSVILVQHRRPSLSSVSVSGDRLHEKLLRVSTLRVFSLWDMWLFLRRIRVSTRRGAQGAGNGVLWLRPACRLIVVFPLFRIVSAGQAAGLFQKHGWTDFVGAVLIMGWVEVSIDRLDSVNYPTSRVGRGGDERWIVRNIFV